MMHWLSASDIDRWNKPLKLCGRSFDIQYLNTVADFNIYYFIIYKFDLNTKDVHF